MKAGNLPFAILASVVIGIAQMFLLLFCWAYIAAYTPLPRWFISLGIHGTPLHALLFVLDFLVSVALCLPAAFALWQLRPRNLPVYLAAAVLPGFIWQYRLVFQDPSTFSQFSLFVPGIVSALLVLPAAVAIISLMRKRVVHT